MFVWCRNHLVGDLVFLFVKDSSLGLAIYSSKMISFLLGIAFLLPLALAIPISDVNPRGFDQMSSLSIELSTRQSISNTRNELGLCKPVTVIFALGTTEPENVGTLTGPPFFNALNAVIDT